MGFALTLAVAGLWGGAAAQGEIVCQTAQGLTACRPALVEEGGLLVVEIEPDARCRAPAVIWEDRWFRTVERALQHQALLPVPLGGVGVRSLAVVCGRLTAVLPVAVAVGGFPESELRVAPRFTKAPPPRVALESEALQQAMAADRPGRTWTAPFLRPGHGRTTAPFGVRRLFNGLVASQHRGLDIDGRTGTPVLAANDGIVTFTARDYYYPGNAVVLDHGERLFTTYYHLSRIDVHSGQRVRRGQVLGAIGRTGRVTGPHLHFGVKLAGIYVDPQALLGFAPDARLGRLQPADDPPGPVLAGEEDAVELPVAVPQ